MEVEPQINWHDTASETSANRIKNGRAHSATVMIYKIQALLKPIVTSKNGPRQQIEARIADIPPADNAKRAYEKPMSLCGGGGT